MLLISLVFLNLIADLLPHLWRSRLLLNLSEFSKTQQDIFVRDGRVAHGQHALRRGRGSHLCLTAGAGHTGRTVLLAGRPLVTIITVPPGPSGGSSVGGDFDTKFKINDSVHEA